MEYGVWHVVDSEVETYAYGTVADWAQYCNFRDDWGDYNQTYKVSEHDTFAGAYADASSGGRCARSLDDLIYAVIERSF